MSKVRHETKNRRKLEERKNSEGTKTHSENLGTKATDIQKFARTKRFFSLSLASLSISLSFALSLSSSRYMYSPFKCVLHVAVVGLRSFFVLFHFIIISSYFGYTSLCAALCAYFRFLLSSSTARFPSYREFMYFDSSHEFMSHSIIHIDAHIRQSPADVVDCKCFCC